MIVHYAMSKDGEIDVIEAESGDEGIRKAREEHPDVILMDMRMEGMDGSKTLASLKQDPTTASIPVIFLTAASDKRQTSQLKKMGAAGILPKPFDPTTLADQVQSILNKK